MKHLGEERLKKKDKNTMELFLCFSYLNELLLHIPISKCSGQFDEKSYSCFSEYTTFRIIRQLCVYPRGYGEREG